MNNSIRNVKKHLKDVPDSENFHEKILYQVKYRTPFDRALVSIYQTEDISIARRIKEALDKKYLGEAVIIV